MRTRLATAVITMMVSISLTGCMSKVKYPAYYTLHLPPAADPPVARGTRSSVAVREFRSPGYLRQGAIVYRESPEELGFYNYHRWAADPREFVTNAIVERMRASGRFAQVKVYDGRSDVDLILSGRLEKLEEVDYESGVRVEVALSGQITDLHSGKTLWADAVSQTAEVDGRTVPGVVAGMSHAMERAIEQLLAPLANSAISLRPPANQP